MTVHAAHPRLQGAIEHIFTEGTVWRRHLEGVHIFASEGLRGTSLFRIPAARRWLVGALTDCSPAGAFRVQNPGVGWNELDGDGSSIDLLEGATREGEEPVRRCELWAQVVALREGAPEFSLTWERGRRDRARGAVVAYARRLR